MSGTNINHIFACQHKRHLVQMHRKCITQGPALQTGGKKSKQPMIFKPASSLDLCHGLIKLKVCTHGEINVSLEQTEGQSVVVREEERRSISLAEYWTLTARIHHCTVTISSLNVTNKCLALYYLCPDDYILGHKLLIQLFAESSLHLQRELRSRVL